jgi:hypothetical protein
MPPNMQGQDAAGRARLEAWASLGLGIALLVFTPAYQPIHPVVQAVPAMIAAVGFAIAISAVRFGSWGTRIVAVCAGCCHVVILLGVGQELFERGKRYTGANRLGPTVAVFLAPGGIPVAVDPGDARHRNEQTNLSPLQLRRAFLS